MNEKTLIVLVLLLLSAICLTLDNIIHYHFFAHLAAIPLEIVLAVIVVEHFMARKEKNHKKHQLLLIKSYLFRSEMKDLFISNMMSLSNPEITINKIRNMTLQEIKDLRSNLSDFTYKSLQDLDKVIQEYVKAKNVFQFFLNWAIENKIELIFEDMIYIIHFIQDATLFNKHNPDKLFAQKAVNDRELAERLHHVVRGGIEKFLDYVIELKQTNQKVLGILLSDYETSISYRSSEQTYDENPNDYIVLK